MIALRVLAAGRPIWQFAILLFYSFYVQRPWQQAIIGAVGAFLLGTNVALIFDVSHPRWPRVRRVLLRCESIVVAAASAVLAFAWPLGPACLLLLPTLMTYAFACDRDLWEGWMMAAPFAVLAFISYPEFHREFPLFVRPFPAPGSVGLSEPAVLAGQNIAMFLAVLVFGSVLALVVSRQRLAHARTETAMGQVREQSQQMARMNQQISDYSAKVYDLAAAEERNRIAGEIHDTVAHRLTALVVQLQAARRLISDEKRSVYDPANEGLATSPRASASEWLEESTSVATSNLEVCEALAREALDEVRVSVRAIRRPADAEGLDVLRQLAANFGALTSMDVTLDVEPGLPPLSARLIASLYRVLEEALTNARRHGQATRVNVAIAQVGGTVAVQVDDNGRGSEEVEFGFGLSSMRDRLQALGAQLEVNSALGSGFSLRFQFPIWEGES